MKNIKGWGIFAIIGYVLSIPLLIWKSSKVGRIMFVFMLIGVISYGITKISGAAFDSYYDFTRKTKLEKLRVKIGDAELQLKKVLNTIELIELTIKEKAQKKIDEEVEIKLLEFQEAKRDEKSRLRSIAKKIDRLQDSVDVVEEEQRKAMKERLFALNEKINVFDADVDTVEVRRELELVTSNIELLDDAERERLFAELKRVGFRIQEMRNSHDAQAVITTSDTVTFFNRW